MNIPQRLGKYPISQVLGKGAMGIVYLGRDPVIKRPVAIKTIRKELIEDDERAESLSERFRREAQAAGALNHPGIVAIYEYGEDEEYAFIAMEYVEGNTLREYQSQGTRFDERDTVSIMAQLLDALEFAHANSVWHRDIKPANIIIMKNGRIKLADFGIARIESSDRTRTNMLMGTPGYIAPEYYLNAPVDHRIDIFAAGVLLYELLAGRAPFRGRPEAIMHDVCYDDPIPPSTVPHSRGWPCYDDVVARALEKSPDQRFQSAGAFRAALLAEYAHPVSSTISEATIISNVVRAVGVEPGTPSAAKSSAFPSSTMPPSDWSIPVLGGIEIELARFIGPVAKVLVRRAARTYKDVDSLVRELLGSLDSDADREAFTRAVTGRSLVLPPGHASPPPPSTALASGPSVTLEDVDLAMKLLTPYIGPIARVVAKRAATPGGSRQDFFVEVSRNLENPSQRERFLRDAGASGR
ncbi:serine/threonine-protein kinase [Rhizobacter sp. Root1221]|uniref:serine/threonine-protein kinase n=1 Tax=Rhizobacter sp. Root1221 TaxID=1736433 RepID=UPI0009EB4AB8|nr:serine/threonine-protein kinase [Rhizobacter sp. Root1221]